MWLQDRVLAGEDGKKVWTNLIATVNAPPRTAGTSPVRTLPTPPSGSTPVLPPAQHAAAFEAFASFGGR